MCEYMYVCVYVCMYMCVRFQWSYLSVYLTVMLADWLQGTNMYTLYQSYGVDVGTLFLVGFSSAAVFGTFLGLFVDRFGRRNGCIVFCLLEARDSTHIRCYIYIYI